MTFKFEIVDHGTEHEQYFQGAGVAFTEYQEIVTGAGNSARQAGEDALERFWLGADSTQIDVASAKALEETISMLSKEEDAHEGCDHTIEDCERYHYLSIRWRY